MPDERLLFTAQFKQSGPDLVLIGEDGHRFKVFDYFNGETRPTLLAPNGAYLSPDLVDLLAGSETPAQYAQAAPVAAPVAIGKVEKVVGSCTVVRNGVSVALNIGDAVYKSDVVQTGSNGALGISFPDGTALSLVANTRMALNDFVYDPNGTANSALISLVQGSFAFVAGAVAHTGDMKVATPVATMGIRGTTGWVQEQVATITATFGNVTYSFAVTNDFGTNAAGVYDLYDQNGNLIATVSRTGIMHFVTPQGPGLPPLVTELPMSDSQLAFEQQIIQSAWQALGLIPAQRPLSVPGSSTPPPDLQQQNDLIPQLHDLSPTFGTPSPINFTFTLFDQTVTSNITFNSEPTVTVTPLPADQLQSNASGTASHPLAFQVEIGGQNTTFVPGSATVTAPAGVPNGLVTVDSQGNLVYDQANFKFLSEGQSVVYTITFEAQSGVNIVEETLTLTIVGANDSPTFSSSDSPAQRAELPLTTNSSQPLTATLALAFTDPDLSDTGYTAKVVGVTASGHTQGLPDPSTVLADLQITGVTKDAGSADGSVTAVFSAPDKAFDYLAEGETVTLVYAIEVDDPHAAAATQTVSITVTGANDTPVILPPLIADTGTFQGPSAGTPNGHGGFIPLIASNNFAFVDPDLSDTHILSYTLDAANTTSAKQQIGNFTLNLLQDSTGGNQGLVNWNFTLDSDRVIELNSLPAGVIIHEIFDVTVDDGHTGGTATRQVAITLEGPDGTVDVWISPNDGNWDDGSNWSLGVPPACGQSVIIDLPVTVTLDSHSADIAGIEVGHSATLDVTYGGALNTRCYIENFGTIESTGCLTLDIGNHQIFNAGTLEASQGARLEIDSDVDNSGTIAALEPCSVVYVDTVTIDNTDFGANDGAIKADGSHAKVELYDTTVIGGILTTLNGGVIDVESGHDDTAMIFDGTDFAVTIQGDVDVVANSTLTLKGTIENDGTLTVEPSASGIFVAVDCDVTLQGDGDLVLGGNKAAIVGGPVGGTLHNHSTISGGGAIGDGYDDLTLHNSGTVDADDPCVALVLDTGCNTVVNHGTLEATNGGNLAIKSDVDNTDHCLSVGQIDATGCDSTVDLYDVTVFGGTLQTSHGGLIETVGDATFDGTNADGLSIADGSHILLTGGTSLTLEGAIHNAGTIEVDYVLFGADLIIDHTVTLDGGGHIVLDTSDDDIIGSSSSSCNTLINCDDIISGGGAIGNGGSTDLTLRNYGTVDADNSSDPLVIDTGCNAIVNHGTLEATSCGDLVIDSNLHNFGTVEATDFGTVTFDCVTIQNDATIEAVTDQYGHGGTFDIIGTVSLEGCGTLTLEDSADKIVGVANEHSTLDNSSTISGGGLIGDGCADLTLHNEYCGVIDATNQFDYLTLDTGTHHISNAGVLEATDGGNLLINSDVSNSCTGSVVAGSGSFVDVAGNINGGSATIHGGTLEYDGCSDVDTSFAKCTTGALVLGADSHFTGTVSGFAAGDVIDLKGIDFSNCTQLSYCATDHTLTVSDGSHGPCETIQLCGDYTQSDFALFNDGNGDAAVTIFQDDAATTPGSIWHQDGSGDLYQFVSNPNATWLIAEAGAVSTGGYLATITSAHENEFIKGIADGQTAWLGGSDSPGEGTSEGHWNWIDGPDAGTNFWNSSGVPGVYSNWNNTSPNAEPNNLDHSPFSVGENFLQFLSDGTWNDEQGPDMPSATTTQGYVIESAPPKANNDSIIASDSAVQSGTLTIPSSVLLDNDSNPLHGDTLLVTSAQGTNLEGTNGLDGNGNVADHLGLSPSDNFQYSMQDELSIASTAQVNVTIQSGSHLAGTSANEIFLPGGADACLTGNGGNDTFLFQSGLSTGKYNVTDFSTHGQGSTDADMIDLTGYSGITNFSDLQSHLHASGGDTVIDLGNCNTVTLQGVNAACLQASDFVFHPAVVGA